MRSEPAAVSVPAEPTSELTGSTGASAAPARGDVFVSSLGSAAAILYAATGLLLVATADALGRAGASHAELPFWAGLALIVGPLAWRASSADVDRAERIGLVIACVVCLYGVKVFLSPTGFAFTGDEYIHIRTAQDILSTRHLFHPNPINLISPRFPGLEVVIAAIASMAHLPIFTSGLIVIGLARLIIVLSLFYTVEAVTASSRVAAISVFIYVANPNFLFEGSQVSYESLGLPLAALAVMAAVRALGRRTMRKAGLILSALLIAAQVPTHHFASYVLAVLLLAWAGAALLMGRRNIAFPVAILGVAASAAAASWAVFVAPEIWSYLTQSPAEGVAQLIHVLTGTSTPRQLFTSGGRTVDPEWERVMAFAAVGVLLAGLPFGLVALWRRHRASPLAWVLALAAAAYPASLALRLTAGGAEASNRASEYLYTGLGFALAVAVAAALERRRSSLLVPAGLLAAFLVAFAGGVITGWARHARVPGPYLVAAGARSIGPQGEDAATWLLAAAGPDNRLAAARTSTLLMAVLGRQDSLTAGGGQGSYWPLFFDSRLTSRDLEIIRSRNVKYVVIDRRLGHGRPLDEVYVEGGEPNIPIRPVDLAKFDGVPGVTRIYDSGAIQIYDVSGLARGRGGSG